MDRRLRRVRKHGGWFLVSVGVLWLTHRFIPEATLRSATEVGGNFLQAFAGALVWVDSFALHAAFVAGLRVVVAAASIAIDLDDPTSGDLVVDWSHFADAASSMELAHCPAPHPSRP